MIINRAAGGVSMLSSLTEHQIWIQTETQRGARGREEEEEEEEGVRYVLHEHRCELLFQCNLTDCMLGSDRSILHSFKMLTVVNAAQTPTTISLSQAAFTRQDRDAELLGRKRRINLKD